MQLDPGSGRFGLPIGPGFAAESLPVWYHLPETFNDESYIVIVLHGTSRAAQSSRDNWAGPAERHGFLVAVPEFGRAHFTDPSYAYGRLWNDEAPYARLDWAASHCRFIDDLFDVLNRALGAVRTGFMLYGHSAGAAFAHRYVMFAPVDRVARAIFANAGWYTLPDPDIALPFGLRESGITSEKRAAFLARDITILVGDDDRNGPYPDWWPPGSERQGEHRVARSLAYFQTARTLAARLDMPFNWRWESVPGVAHENAKMIAPAVRIITGSQ